MNAYENVYHRCLRCGEEAYVLMVRKVDGVVSGEDPEDNNAVIGWEYLGDDPQCPKCGNWLTIEPIEAEGE